MFADQNGITCFVDQNGNTCFVDQNGIELCCAQTTHVLWAQSCMSLALFMLCAYYGIASHAIGAMDG
jgi:hypothetical protein